MSKHSEKQNRWPAAHSNFSRLTTRATTKVQLLLAVVVITASYDIFAGRRDLSASDNLAIVVGVSIKLGQPNFSGNAIAAPTAQAGNSATTLIAETPRPSGKTKNANLQLIDPTLVTAGGSSTILIQPRLASSHTQRVTYSGSRKQMQQVSDGSIPNVTLTTEETNENQRSAHAIGIPANRRTRETNVAKTQSKSGSAQNPHTGRSIDAVPMPAIGAVQRIDRNANLIQCPDFRQSPNQLLGTAYATPLIHSQETRQHSLVQNSTTLPIMVGQSRDTLSRPLQTVNPASELEPRSTNGPIQPVPMVPGPISNGEPTLSSQTNGTGDTAPPLGSPIPLQDSGDQPESYGRNHSTIEAIPLKLSPYSKTHGEIPPLGIPHEFGHSVANVTPGTNFGHSIFNRFPGTSGFRATVETDAEPWMAPYNARVLAAVTGNPNQRVSAVPAGYGPWWDTAVKHPVNQSTTTLAVDVRTLLQDAMLYSPQVTAIKTEPEVQYRVITQEEAKFDWTAFLEATYDNLNDPVGNDLTTGNGQDRLLTQKVGSSGGIRRKNMQGDAIRLAQNLGHENQNSLFFVPNNQGSARLELSYRQPLLDGAGRTYNESEMVLARIQANASEDEVVDALQSHLIKVTEAYWTLYRARAEFFQRQKLLASAIGVLERLEDRSQVDTIPRQVLRARAAVARAQTRTQRTFARVQDSEAQLRLLVNSPSMLSGGQTELMPMEAPGMVTENAGLQSILQTALVNRPDISEAIRKMRADGVRLGVSRTELLPRLDLVVETYVADLAGNSNVGRAISGELLDNRPGYTIGLEFEVPVGNRAAVAKLEQRQWELKRSINIFRATVEKSLTDVEIANREVRTAYSEISSHYQSMEASENESRYLKNRFEVLPASEDSAILLLEDLLDSFERLADEESAFVKAQVDHAVALVKLKKELGVLLKSRDSRPDVADTQKEWMQGRLDSTVQSHIAASAPLRTSTSFTADVETNTGSFVPISSGHEPNFGSTTDTRSSTEPAEIQGQTRPTPMFPTTWGRLPDSSLRPTRP